MGTLKSMLRRRELRYGVNEDVQGRVGWTEIGGELKEGEGEGKGRV